MKTKTKFILSIVCSLLFGTLILLVSFVDRAAIGPKESVVGLAGVNGAVHDFFGAQMWLYTVTEWLGYAAIAGAAAIALFGFRQVIKRKSLFAADAELYATGVLYIVTIALYIFFEFVIINYRPEILPGKAELEASFPSSHSMTVGVIAGSAALLARKYIRKNKVRVAFTVCCAIIAVFTVVGRLLSGVHWFTDIIAGALLSAALLFLYAGVLDMLSEGKRE